MGGRRPGPAPGRATANDLPSLSVILRALTLRLLDIALTPLRVLYSITQSVVGKTGPPIVHLALIGTLLPLIAFWSLGAGLVVRSWVPTGWRQVAYLQYGTSAGSAPWADVQLPALNGNQPYDISVELVLPLHSKNTELGNFMTSIAITTPTNQTLASSSRPSLIFPHPVSSLFPFSPLMYSGALRTHTVRIPLMESFSASSYATSLRARLQVGRSDAWKGIGNGEGRELVIVEAYIRGIPRMSGIRGFFLAHPNILMLFTSISFFLATSLAALVAYLAFSPSIKFAPRPLATPPTYFGVGTKAHLEGPGVEGDGGAPPLAIKQEEEQGSLGFMSSPGETSASASGSIVESIEGESEEGSVVEGEEEDDDDMTETGTVTEEGTGEVIGGDNQSELETDTGSDEGDGEVVDLGSSAAGLRH